MAVHPSHVRVSAIAGAGNYTNRSKIYEMKFETTVFLVSCAIVILGGTAIFGYLKYRDNQSRVYIPMPTNTGDGWFLYTADDHTAKESLSMDNGALRCECTQSNGQPSGVLVTQNRVIADAGRKYRISFAARSDSPHKITVTAEQGGYGGSNDNIGLTETYTINDRWSKHDATFTATGKLGHRVAMPVFNLGAKTGTVWIKDVLVEEVN
jgi:hypothetical protein